MNLAAWAGGICMAAAGCAALHMLIENTGIGKTLRLLTAAFFLCAVLLPLRNLKGNINLSQDITQTADVAAMEETALQQIKTMTEQILLEKVNEALQSHDISAKKIEINMDTSADESISITDIVLYIPSGNSLHRTRAAEIAEKRLGMEVRVEYVG